MLLTITHHGKNAADIGYLFRKNPTRPQVFALNYGKAFVFYPEVSDEKTTIALLLEIDPVDLAKGKEGAKRKDVGLFDYVNDRPYVSSSFMSVALAKVFGTAMTGRSDEFQALADTRLDLSATLTMLPCKSDTEMLNRVFEPLGYQVEFETFPADENFPDWGESRYVNLTINGHFKLSDLLHHLYVLIPVFDRKKHYWIDREEVEKLLRHSEEWLKDHPEKFFITHRYLFKNRALANHALERLSVADEEAPTEDLSEVEEKEERLNLNRQRLGSVLARIRACGATSVIDLGCGEGHLLALLMKETSLQKIAGVDVVYMLLERAKEKLHYERFSERQKQKLALFQGSLTYKDSRFSGYDIATVVEVIEHLDLPRLSAFERVLFEFARPKHVILTTPNREYNARYENLGTEQLRHGDHRFEWTRAEFRKWAQMVSAKFHYATQFSDIGEADEKLGSPTQMVCFSLNENTEKSGGKTGESA
ncbi:MAG: 3' terminal RNA ribose 2'-O-methyltransferase Hen1 [Zoogloeaceae bacterium]|jgi:3' terminal RNA ribose 2'-O-methyltransferase Hen1|nr:3' terminal RNA ribose 2'-O-methyltransferase Hen1 [Zoogloeaceae bacterium]